MAVKILVTGGAGFIGSALCRHIIANTESSVVNVDSLTYAANLNSLSPVSSCSRYAFEKVDICDRETLTAVFADYQPDAVMHLAAESHVDRSISCADAFLMTNVMGTYRLLDCAHNYWSKMEEPRRQRFRLLHVSTDEVYGSLGSDGQFLEDTPYDPSSPYSASKAASDHLARAWYRTYGLPVVISNCSNNYGPYHFPEKLIPLMILNGLEGRPLPVYGNGSNVRDWLFVEDHVRALMTILSRGRLGEQYNVGGCNERTNLQVVETICDILDLYAPTDAARRGLIQFVADRPGHDQRYAIDASKLENELGWRARETFDSGIDKTVRWYLANREWWQPLRTDVYNGQRLGLLGNAVPATALKNTTDSVYRIDS